MFRSILILSFNGLGISLGRSAVPLGPIGGTSPSCLNSRSGPLLVLSIEGLRVDSSNNNHKLKASAIISSY